jgi:hypothetical protein
MFRTLRIWYHDLCVQCLSGRLEGIRERMKREYELGYGASTLPRVERNFHRQQLLHLYDKYARLHASLQRHIA